MPLPFLQKKQMSGIIVSHRKKDGAGLSEGEQEGSNSAMEAAAEDILRAISSKDAQHLALALQAAYDICESNEPESEDSAEPHSYDSQNEKAAQEQE